MAKVTKTRVERGIYKLADGVYDIAVSAGKQPDGTYKQVWRRHRGTLNSARTARRNLLGEVDRGEHTGGAGTVNELLDAWLADLEHLGRAPKTIKGYRNDASTYWRPTLGAKRVGRVERADVKKVLTDLRNRGLEPITLRHVHACISAAFSWAVEDDRVARDVTKKIKLPEVIRTRPVVPTPANVATILRAAAASDRPEMARFTWLGAITGARSSELRALRLSRLHLDEGRIGIDAALSNEVEWTTKNRQWRDVGLDALTITVVEDQVAFMRERAEAGGCMLEADAFLFSDDQTGRKAWREEVVTKWWSALADDVGLGQFTFKHLRKFMDTHGQELGFSVDDVADRAGHTADVARKHYTGVRAATDRRLSAALAGVLDELQKKSEAIEVAT